MMSSHIMISSRTRTCTAVVTHTSSSRA
eukprot:COSAG01_NODE_48082_length_384_cov_0.838596_1_plen_27_part_10